MRTRLPALEKALWVTEEEALTLLTLVVASAADVGAAEEGVLLKLGDLCRAFLRDEQMDLWELAEAA